MAQRAMVGNEQIQHQFKTNRIYTTYIYIIKQKVQFTLTVKLENGSEQQLELGKAVYFHPHYSIFCLNK